MNRLILAATAAATLGMAPAYAQNLTQVPVQYPFLANNANSNAPAPSTSGATAAEISANQAAGQYFSDETNLSPRAIVILQRIAL
ncbi:hypothetical protein LX81_02387 [Palleronia aestuarii]|uniref:Uncharacterized protein n=1 Tax=Palleronia aestuarii TaxID=568105 RepID=A0A2W7N5S7_9RHOB|nr:hypothetical protein [Palleronia aestuarii]PZX15755.1 hypothetical protein LX81_02387 [Palleronia aestuarii]